MQNGQSLHENLSTYIDIIERLKQGDIRSICPLIPWANALYDLARDWHTASTKSSA